MKRGLSIMRPLYHPLNKEYKNMDLQDTLTAEASAKERKQVKEDIKQINDKVEDLSKAVERLTGIIEKMAGVK